MTLTRWLNALFSASPASDRRYKASSRGPAFVETLETRLLLAAENLVALELPMAAGDSTQEVTYDFELTDGQATFAEFGIFIFDADGTIGGVAPGDAGFQAAVLNSASRQTLLVNGSPLNSVVQATVEGGSRLGVYFCQDPPTASAGDHISFSQIADQTLRLGWEEIPPYLAGISPPSPRWFDDAVLEVTSSEPILNEIQSAQLTLFANSDQIALPANIGVQADDSMERAFTTDDSGQIMFNIADPVTLGEFFEIWRTNAGLAGNNPDAVFSATQLLDNTADSTNTVQMFVNGQINRDFENYIVQAGDDIVLVFGSNPVVSMNTNFGSIVMELFPNETPITVDNFLNYVNDTNANGDNYENTFFHRSDPGFVIQGGGFTTPSEIFTDTNQFGDVVSDPIGAQITNEPGISNTRGTIAMAKLGGQPNSATSQFFVNLSDANTFLDSSNGGFTVFAQVLGLTTVDRIEAIPVDMSNPSPYGELPLTDDNRLVVIESFAGQGSLTGVKFSDDNQNGIQDGGEAGIAGISIYIDANNNGVLDAGEISTTTDANGQYILQVEPGTHVVRAELSAGATQTVPTAPDSYTVDVLLGRVFADLDFGEF